MRRAGILFLAIVALFGCGSTPPPQTSADLHQARQLDLNDSGRRAVVRGDLGRAAAYYEESLRLAQEVEDFHGVALNALNLAAVRQALGEVEAARRALDRITASPARYEGRFIADAAGRQAQLALQAGRPDVAKQWLDRAEQACLPPACASGTALLNLRGQLLLARGSVDEARSAAARALAASRAEGNREEEANALRLDGRVAARLGDHGSASARFEGALEIDRQLALPQKIAQDLLALSETELGRANTGLARDYAQRALDVSRASGNQPQQEQAARLLERAK